MSNPFSVLRVRKTLEWLKSKHAIMVVIYGLTTDSLGRCQTGLHKLWYPGIRDRSTWSKFGAHGEHGDVFLFSNLGAL